MDAKIIITINLLAQEDPTQDSSTMAFYTPTDDFICTGRWRIDHINNKQVLKVEITYKKYEMATEPAKLFGIFHINKIIWTKTDHQTEWVHENEFHIKTISEIQECSHKRTE